MHEDSGEGMSQQPIPAGHASSHLVAFYQPPRLSIIHLLAWMAVAAVLLSLTMSIDHWLRGSAFSKMAETATGAFSMVLWTIGQIVLAAGVVGLVIIIRDRIRHIPGHLQPGHWIVLGSCAGRLAGMLINLILAPFFSTDFQTTSSTKTTIVIIIVRTAIATLPAVVVYWLAAKRCQASRIWRRTFYIWALFFVSCVFFEWSFLFGYLVTGFIGFAVGLLLTLPLALASAVAFSKAVIEDIRDKTRRDWIHWLGVTMVTSTFILTLMGSVWRWITR